MNKQILVSELPKKLKIYTGHNFIFTTQCFQYKMTLNTVELDNKNLIFNLLKCSRKKIFSLNPFFTMCANTFAMNCTP